MWEAAAAGVIAQFATQPLIKTAETQAGCPLATSTRPALLARHLARSVRKVPRIQVQIRLRRVRLWCHLCVSVHRI